MGPILFLLGMILFLGIHSVRIAAPGWVRGQEVSMGDNRWKLLYTVVSIIGLVLIIWFYGSAQIAWPILWYPPVWTQHIALTLMIFAAIAIAVYALPAGRLKPMLKHPMLVAVKIWALSHLIANGDLASIVLFGGFLAWAVADRISVKRRERRFDSLEAGQPARIRGPVIWDLAALALGIVIYVLFVFWLHLWLIGVSPIG